MTRVRRPPKHAEILRPGSLRIFVSSRPITERSTNALRRRGCSPGLTTTAAMEPHEAIVTRPEGDQMPGQGMPGIDAYPQPRSGFICHRYRSMIAVI
jgi:hypothetical protein